MNPKHRNIAAGILAYECSKDPQYKQAWHNLFDGVLVVKQGSSPLWNALTATTLLGVIDGYAEHMAAHSDDPVGTYTDTFKYLRYLTEA